jgi:hypothetical protein
LLQNDWGGSHRMQRISRLPANDVNARVAGDLEKPRGERRVLTVCESAYPAPNPNEHLLSHILGGIRVSDHAIDKVKNGPLVPLENLGKGCFVAGLSLRNQALFDGAVGVRGHSMLSVCS